MKSGTAIVFVFCVIAFTAFMACAQGEEGADHTLSPYFFVKSDDSEVDQFPLLFTGATVNIAGVIADVTVTQIYKNEGTRPIEAMYVFPASTRAAVYGLTMTIGERTVFAEIRERQQARQEYEQAKQEGKTTSLLEQERPNVFQMNVANILPGDTIRVELKYTELLVPTDGIYEFVYPTVVGPRYSNQSAVSASDTDTWVSNPYLPATPGEELATKTESPYLFDITTRLAAGIPLQQVSCTTHPVHVSYQGPTEAIVTLDDAAMIEKLNIMPPDNLERVKTALQELYIGKDIGNLPAFYIKLFRIAADNEQPRAAMSEQQTVKTFTGDRDYILRYQLAGDKIESGVLLYEGCDENFFLLMAQPPKHVEPEQISPREYIFIVDVSGSMNGFPLDISKELLRKLIADLRPTDTFNVVLFASASDVLSERSLPATPTNIKQALHVIDRQQGGGSTELLSALQRAFTLPKTPEISRTIVIVTDGFVMVEAEAFDLIRTHLNQANVFAFGVGTSVNRFLIEGLSHIGSGEAFIATNPNEARVQADRFRQYIQSPVLTNITVDIEGFEAYDVEPVSIPDVFAERPVMLFGKWKRDARGELQGTFRLTGIAGKAPYTRSFDVSEVTPSETHAALRYLWARKRIELLGDYEALRANDDRVKEITNLGLKYHLLTAYTSFVAIDLEVRQSNDHYRKTVRQPLPMPQGVSNYAIGTPVPEPGTIVLVGMGILGITALYKRRRQSR